MKRPKDEVYPNAPLVDVTFEVRFPGEPAIECRRDLLFARVRKEFPKVYVPFPQPGQALALAPYEFKDEKGSRSLRVALNSLGYDTNAYRGFADFRKEALSALRPTGKMFRLNRISRVGLRYVNLIPFVRTNGGLPLRDFLNVRIEAPMGESMDPSQFVFAVQRRCGKGSMTVRVESVKSAQDGKEAFLLDFDYSRAEALRFGRIADYLDEGHAHTKRLFEELITSEYREVMRKESIQ